MPSIKQVTVSCERLLAKLKAEYPNLYTVTTSHSPAITAAGAGFTLGQLAASAKKHDPSGDKHDVHYHSER